MKVVVLGTGGTIAGVGDAGAPRGYRSGEVAIGSLLEGVALPAGIEVQCEQVAQVDSKDMDEVLWLSLARRARHWLSRPDVAGVVVTHGTDTLEETAYFLHATLGPAKPLVLTGAMRPSTDPSPDGPGNLRDAIRVAGESGARGVLVAFAGKVFAGSEARKVHPLSNDAFEGGGEGAVAVFVDGALRRRRDWPDALDTPDAAVAGEAMDAMERRLEAGSPALPWVAMVTGHAGSDGREVRALVAAGVEGIVAVGTGNAMLHRRLEAALAGARGAGVAVVHASRCSLGDADAVEPGGTEGVGGSGRLLQPGAARVALQLALLRTGAAGPGRPVSWTGPAARGR